MKQLSSLQNPIVKQIIQLKEKSRLRKKTNLFCVEGFREITLAIKGNYTLKTILWYSQLFSEEKLMQLKQQLSYSVSFIEISKEIYQKIAHRETTEGIIAIAEAKNHNIGDVVLGDNSLILVVEAPEKPGNIGAILRTADAANVDLVCIANPKTDIYNPNSIRNSVGCVFTNKIVVGNNLEIIQFLKSKNINIYTATLLNGVNYTETDFTTSSAIIIGTEATGLTDEWLQASSKNITIPMSGEIDSLNMSTAAAILIFEAKRQKMINNE